MKSSRLTLILLMLLSLPLACPGGEHDGPRPVNFDIEWGTMCNVYRFHHFYYIPDEGGVVFDTKLDYPFLFTGQILFGAEFNILKWLSAGVHTGYYGIYEGRAVIPVLARVNFYPWGKQKKTLYMYGDGGLTFGLQEFHRGSMYHAGGAFRVPIGNGMNIDFKLAGRLCHDHPDIKNPDKEGIIPPDRVRSSQVLMIGAEFSVGISF